MAVCRHANCTTGQSRFLFRKRRRPRPKVNHWQYIATFTFSSWAG